MNEAQSASHSSLPSSDKTLPSQKTAERTQGKNADIKSESPDLTPAENEEQESNSHAVSGGQADLSCAADVLSQREIKRGTTPGIELKSAPDGEAESTPDLTELCDTVLSRVLSDISGTVRPGQTQMMHAIATAIRDRARVLVQAGTGTGKSLGYLIPSCVHAVTGNARVLISTATLALQRQILTHDAPIVSKVLQGLVGYTPRVALLKGWSNYICMHKLAGGYPDEDTLFDSSLLPGESEKTEGPTSPIAAEIMSLREWARTTPTGDRDDMVPGPTDRAWRHVSVSRRECIGRSCPMLEECFAHNAREKAAHADIVVTNHSLLGIHATGENDLFSDIDMVVVDEAHELAERVRSQAAVSLSASQLARVTRSARTHGRIDTHFLEEITQELSQILEDLPLGLLYERPQILHDALRRLDEACRDAYTQVSDSDAEAASKTLARAALDEITAVCAAWSRPAEETVTWVEYPEISSTPHPQLVLAPLDVARAIGTVALGQGPAVLTSATLNVGSSFDPIAYECGLFVSDVPWSGIDVGTPFDEAHQGIFYVARHLPPPDPAGISLEALEEIVDLVQASGGGALVLCSSRRAVHSVTEILRSRVRTQVFAQGDASVSSLVEQFRDDVNSSLVGTLGLWQGVDVPGLSCRLVIIDKIPFPHPHDPVIQALSDVAQRNRRSGFWTVSLPRAALLMAQGAGRLLRTSEDRGVLAVLDKRLVTKSYGAMIRRSMPALWPTSDPKIVREALSRLSSSVT
ncbi:ATP-dependent DNA helicase [Schaalia sp. lx-100]|uniref:ATP-dependent DNA helicase n=1 Tax=Schaalia sp. lx-100 TaxID=2899081 RepID=UPI001E500A2D|nr:ATP-dependent DNA helicase [Schaalia sp. lx-100]MCD4557032.1 ATP-dependent DNA helicase [Schaalia sp. lx-100]